MTTFDSTETMPNSDALNDSDSSMDLVEMIETVISSVENDQSAMVSHTDGGHLWKFGYGTVEVFVQLTGLTEDDSFTVWSNLLMLPAKDEPQLMHKLLEMNWAETFEARFGIFGNQIVILSTRAVAEISPGEVSRLITIVATIADEQDEVLQSKFGAPS
ncbi:MAG: YbjN domain-containing protein [Elainellaceae cyanobacterium]